jgi:hypothetical protein
MSVIAKVHGGPRRQEARIEAPGPVRSPTPGAHTLAIRAPAAGFTVHAAGGVGLPGALRGPDCHRGCDRPGFLSAPARSMWAGGAR